MRLLLALPKRLLDDRPPPKTVGRSSFVLCSSVIVMLSCPVLECAAFDALDAFDAFDVYEWAQLCGESGVAIVQQAWWLNGNE